MKLTQELLNDVIDRKMTRSELREIFHFLFDRETPGANLDWLREVCAYEIQRRVKYPKGEPENVRAKREALSLDEPPVAVVQTGKKRRRLRCDPRLPAAGTILSREYQGKVYRVRVNANSIDLLKDDGSVLDDFTSLSGVAAAICGCESNGFRFFGLTEKGDSK